MKDVTKLTVIQSVIDKKRTGKEASKILELSERQIWRLVKKIKENGREGIKHGNCNKPSKNKIPQETIDKIIKLKNSYDYEKANFSHFRELLEEKEKIKISYTSLYNIMKTNGFASKNKHKDRKVHRSRKRRKSFFKSS